MTLPKIKLNGINFLNLIGGIVVVYLLVVLGQTIKKNYELGVQAEELRAEKSLLQSQKEQLSYNIQYYGTDSYRDREARSKLGLQLPGENVIIIPQTSPTPGPITTQPAKLHTASNMRQWLDFLGGKL